MAVENMRAVNMSIDSVDLDHAELRDTNVVGGSEKAVSAAVAAALQAVDAVMMGEHRNAFVAIRPPGHHARSEKSSGFCLVNNVMIAAKHAVEGWGLDRVMIIDFDAHHGRATEPLGACAQHASSQP
jgi:acetoin utilization deacetylase AcuC-like enzyme